MKLKLANIFAAFATVLVGSGAFAQCPVITCPGDITTNVDPATCGATINYTAPVGTDACASNGNVLFVCDGDNSTAYEIPAELTAAGYTVTTVYNDYVAGNNATLQGALGGYIAVFWHASGANGVGETHNAATFTNLTSYVNVGGAVFVTGYDVIASPADPELITFMGGTSSTDGGTSGSETLVGSNSLTTGVTNIVGLTLASPGDHDGLNGLLAGTVAVATNGTSHGWTIRTLGAGEIAWVSTANYVGQPWAQWNTPGTGYKEALLNFAFNHQCSSVGNFLFVSDNAGGTEIPAALIAEGHNVTIVYNDFVAGENATLQGALNAYDAIFWNAVGSNGAGDVHNATTFTNLMPYVTAGGNVFVTGYDVIISPADPELVSFLGGTSSNDVGPGNFALTGTNSLTTGFATITGLTPIAVYGDYDNLNGLTASVEVVLAGSAAGGAEWSINTIGSGEAAWLSSGQYGTNAMPEWTSLGSIYHEALLNFAYNSVNCGGNSPITTMTAGLAPGAVFPVGVTTVTYEVTDYMGGNAQSCSFTVTVTDNEAPLADLASLPDATDECSITPASPTATDNCAGVLTATPDVTFPISAQGTTVVTWTYDDGNGNISTQAQNIVIMDATAPFADIVSLADVTDCFTSTPTAPTATDNCVGSLTGMPDVTFPITTAGLTVVTWTYDDGNGNISTQAQNVTVNTVDVGVTQTGALLTADATGAAYQWLDCDNGNSIIIGETSISYSAAAVTGNYAVEVTENGCVDTSACFLVDYTGLDELADGNVMVYPNPSSGELQVTFNGLNEGIIQVMILDLQGRIIHAETVIINNEIATQKFDISETANGIYLVKVYAENEVIFSERITKL